MSQSQDEGNNIILSPTLQTPDNLHLLSTVCNDVLAGNSPMVAPASIAKEPTPIIDSPTKLQIDDAINKVLFARKHDRFKKGLDNSARNDLGNDQKGETRRHEI